MLKMPPHDANSVIPASSPPSTAPTAHPSHALATGFSAMPGNVTRIRLPPGFHLNPLAHGAGTASDRHGTVSRMAREG